MGVGVGRSHLKRFPDHAVDLGRLENDVAACDADVAHVAPNAKERELPGRLATKKQARGARGSGQRSAAEVRQGRVGAT